MNDEATESPRLPSQTNQHSSLIFNLIVLNLTCVWLVCSDFGHLACEGNIKLAIMVFQVSDCSNALNTDLMLVECLFAF